MASNVPDEQLEHLIMCAVCLEHLKSPKMLYCGHTFCKLCLTSIVAKNKLVLKYLVNFPFLALHTRE